MHPLFETTYYNEDFVRQHEIPYRARHFNNRLQDNDSFNEQDLDMDLDISNLLEDLAGGPRSQDLEHSYDEVAPPVVQPLELEELESA